MQIDDAWKGNYYDTLEIDRNATVEEIKKAFRRLAKLYHPDNNQSSQKKAETRLKNVMAAYRVLSNKRERARYDVLLRNRPSHYRERDEQDRQQTARMRAQSLLEYLLSSRGKEALEMFDRIKQENFDLEEYLGERDHLDCLFLLAEQLEEADRDKEAVDLYEELYRREKEPPRRRYFFDEIELRLQKLYSRKLPLKAATPDEEISCYERMLEFDIDRNEEAFIWKKIAEVYMRKNQKRKAEQMLQRALQLQPALKGTAIIRCELGMGPPPKEQQQQQQTAQ